MVGCIRPFCAQVYLYTGRGSFKVMERKEVERQAQARHALAKLGCRVAVF